MSIRNAKRTALTSALESHFSPTTVADDELTPVETEGTEPEVVDTVTVTDDDEGLDYGPEPTTETEDEPLTVDLSESGLPVSDAPEPGSELETTTEEPATIEVDANAAADNEPAADDTNLPEEGDSVTEVQVEYPGDNGESVDASATDEPEAVPNEGEEEPATAEPEDTTTVVTTEEGEDGEDENATVITLVEDAVSDEVTEASDISEIEDEPLVTEEEEVGIESFFGNVAIWLKDRRMRGSKKAVLPRFLRSDTDYLAISKTLSKRAAILRSALEKNQLEGKTSSAQFELDKGSLLGLFTQPTVYAQTGVEHLGNLRTTLDLLETLQAKVDSKVHELGSDVIEFAKSKAKESITLDELVQASDTFSARLNAIFKPFMKSKLNLSSGDAMVEAQASQGMTGSVFLIMATKVDGYEAPKPLATVMAAKPGKNILKEVAKQKFGVLGAESCLEAVELLERTYKLARSVHSEGSDEVTTAIYDALSRFEAVLDKDEQAMFDDAVNTLLLVAIVTTAVYPQIYNAAVAGAVTASVLANRSINRLVHEADAPTSDNDDDQE